VCDDRILVDLKTEAAIRNEVRREMTMHRRGTGRKAVTDAALDIYENTGYDLRRLARDAALEREAAREQREEAEEERKREEAQIELERQQLEQEERHHRERMEIVQEMEQRRVDEINEFYGMNIPGPRPDLAHHRPRGPYLMIEGPPAPEPPRVGVSVGTDTAEDEHKEHVECDHVAKVIPRFVAAVTCALRMKFGNMSGSDANRLLIEREYLKLCRETDIRNVDAATHHQWVINTFFNEGVMDHLATTRSRLPKWLAKAMGGSPKPAPTTC